MKKLAIGCGVVVLVLAVAAGVAFYIAANKARSFLRHSGVLASLQTLSKGVTNQAPFTPPANGELTEDMVKRFAAVQESMHATMGGRFQEIAAMQEEMLRREQAEQRKSTAAEDVKNVSAMMGFIVQAQGAWVDALNQQRFSMDEYQWVRVYAAAGLHALEISLRDLPDALRTGGVGARPIPGSGDPVSEHNRQVVAPYVPKMKEWVVLAFFGL
jgi:hypothetical protein